MTRIKAFTTATDLLVVEGFEPMDSHPNGVLWKPLFYSKDFVMLNPDMELEDFRIDAMALREFGIGISKAR